ncbi:MAG TPA: polyprenyl diphosphate synthase [Methylibium sp.]
MSEFASSTLAVPQASRIPRHIAIIMDGNGRWAKQRGLPRLAGHERGGEAVRRTVRACLDLGIEYLTLFAFSTENWRRPPAEVSWLQRLFMQLLRREVNALHEHGVRLVVAGDIARFDAALVEAIRAGESLTRDNRRLTLTIAASYGGRWDILQATHRLLEDRPGIATQFDEKDLAPYLAMQHAPEPDLFIRTGGEQRVSNFLLWQLAYTELYFTDTLWPDFDAEALQRAIGWYGECERRFGRTSEQLSSP